MGEPVATARRSHSTRTGTCVVVAPPHLMPPERLPPSLSARAFRLAAVAGCVGVFAGCAIPSVAPVPLSAETSAKDLAARSLQDADLHRFLTENLGHEPGEWDFETLSWVAFYYHPSLELARAEWAAARATQQTVAARPNPAISIAPGYSTNPGAGVSPWFPAVNFDFLLPTSKKRAWQADIARADTEAARRAVLSAAWLVRSDLRRALVDEASAMRRTSLLREQAAVQQELVVLAEQRLAAGAAAASEAVTARLAAVRTEAAVNESLTQAAAARARAAAALGLPVAALDRIKFLAPEAGPAMSAEALALARQASLQTRADVLAALAHYESAQAALALEAAKQQPDIHLGPGYQWDQGQNKWSLALTVELPLFHRNEGPIAEATARRAEAAAHFTIAQSRAIAAVDTAAAAQGAAAVGFAHARHHHELAEKQVALAQARLVAGETDRVELQNARLALADSSLALADAEAAVAQAAGELEDALQIPFPNLAALADPACAKPPRTP